MHDGGQYSKVGIVAGSLWALVGGLLVAAWVVVLVAGHELWHVGAMLALTGCATSALAATVHIKSYACRISRLIRVTGGIEDDEPGRGSSVELRRMR